MKEFLEEKLTGVRTLAIAGHVNPDGDCVGSCTGLFTYLRDNFPEIRADLYLENFHDSFRFLPGIGEARDVYEGQTYDCVILLDVSSPDRIGVSKELLTSGTRSLCIDHHVSNPGFADENIIEAEASSASELLYTLLDPEKVSSACASCIYTGIIHDTGVFQYSCTGPRTMRIAADLIGKGAAFTSIIEDTFYGKSFAEQRILGHVLDRCELLCGGECIYGYVTQEEMRDYQVGKPQLDGIVAQMRLTEGVEMAVFVYPAGDGISKVSFRSRQKTDVSRLAARFGGGGHVRAAGCTLPVPVTEAKSILEPAVRAALADG